MFVVILFSDYYYYYWILTSHKKVKLLSPARFFFKGSLVFGAHMMRERLCAQQAVSELRRHHPALARSLLDAVIDLKWITWTRVKARAFSTRTPSPLIVYHVRWYRHFEIATPHVSALSLSFSTYIYIPLDLLPYQSCFIYSIYVYARCTWRALFFFFAKGKKIYFTVEKSFSHIFWKETIEKYDFTSLVLPSRYS